MHSCSGCSNTWTGMKQAHCASCHVTFSTPTNFDLHIRATTKYKQVVSIECLAPADAGLVQNDRQIWRMPDERDISDWGKKDE
jgi:hypothetical protein